MIGGLHRDNLRDAGKSDGKLTALVDDNAAQFAALGLGSLPGRSAGKRVKFHLSYLSTSHRSYVYGIRGRYHLDPIASNKHPNTSCALRMM